MNLIELRDINKTYLMGDISVPILKNVSLNVSKGEFVALMGTSGSGKSTLMNILGCLDRPTSGEYWLDGQEISRLSGDERALLRNSRLGFIFQSFNLLARTSALENVAMPLEYSAGRLTEPDIRQRAAAMLRRFGLAERLDYHPSRLSGGQQQRVAISRALINRPAILFADEPTGNLDSTTSREVLQIFEELNRDDGITIIMVTHDANVADHAQRVIHIRDGIIAHGSGSENAADTGNAEGEKRRA